MGHTVYKIVNQYLGFYVFFCCSLQYLFMFMYKVVYNALLYKS